MSGGLKKVSDGLGKVSDGLKKVSDGLGEGVGAVVSLAQNFSTSWRIRHFCIRGDFMLKSGKWRILQDKR